MSIPNGILETLHSITKDTARKYLLVGKYKGGGGEEMEYPPLK